MSAKEKSAGIPQLVRLNPTRVGLRDRLDQLIADYNAGVNGAEKVGKKVAKRLPHATFDGIFTQ